MDGHFGTLMSLRVGASIPLRNGTPNFRFGSLTQRLREAGSVWPGNAEAGAVGPAQTSALAIKAHTVDLRKVA